MVELEENTTCFEEEGDTKLITKINKINPDEISDSLLKLKEYNKKQDEIKKEENKNELTLIIDKYLKSITKENIQIGIAHSILLNRNYLIIHNEEIRQYSSHYRLNRDNMVNTPLCNLNIYHNKLTTKVENMNESIMQMVNDVLPDDYRLNSSYAFGFNTNYQFLLFLGTF